MPPPDCSEVKRGLVDATLCSLGAYTCLWNRGPHVLYSGWTRERTARATKNGEQEGREDKKRVAGTEYLKTNQTLPGRPLGRN